MCIRLGPDPGLRADCARSPPVAERLVLKAARPESGCGGRESDPVWHQGVARGAGPVAGAGPPPLRLAAARRQQATLEAV